MFKRLQYLVWLLSVLLIIVGSLLPAGSPVVRAVGTLPVSEKMLHFCAYTWLALLSVVLMSRISLPAALAMLLLGVSLEFGQKLVPGRAFELRDMLINSLGVLTGVLLAFVTMRIHPVRTF